MSYDTTEVLTNGQDPDYWPDQHHAPDCKCLLCEWLPIARSRQEAAVHAARSAGEAHGAVKERERIAADLEIINTSVGEGIEVPVLGSKKMRRFIDSPEKLKSYFEALQGEKES